MSNFKMMFPTTGVFSVGAAKRESSVFELVQYRLAGTLSIELVPMRSLAS